MVGAQSGRGFGLGSKVQVSEGFLGLLDFSVLSHLLLSDFTRDGQ